MWLHCCAGHGCFDALGGPSAYPNLFAGPGHVPLNMETARRDQAAVGQFGFAADVKRDGHVVQRVPPTRTQQATLAVACFALVVV